MERRMNLSFAGCGFLGIYHVGVAVCLKKHAPQLLLERIGGASAGALAACCLLCDLPIETMAADFLRVVGEARRHPLGPFSPWFNLQRCLLEGMQRELPEDAHRRVSGRLRISLTRVRDRCNVVMSEFGSRQELLQALLCSCFIPGLSGLIPPQVRGVRYMDGAFSDNLPLLDEDTVTVSPFCGESDICPRDRSSHLFHLNINWANTCIRISRPNLRRMLRIVLPGRAEFLSSFCQQGYDDALYFLNRNNLIGRLQKWDQCQEHLLPQAVRDTIDGYGYMEQANKELGQWLSHPQSGIQLFCLPSALITAAARLAPPLARQVVRMIGRRLSQSLTLCEQPHFDLGLLMMHCSSVAPLPLPPPLPRTRHSIDNVDANGIKVPQILNSGKGEENDGHCDRVSSGSASAAPLPPPDTDLARPD
ncbi:1-acylglycerol-3-phosphate O-acyltransferase Pnpla3 [Drosophila pseudoobscura]|uniref:triacylglycerol lipase n=1 Tax=Drosophila pseudoobscura pseudoobscura TaxID=46245 RepID=A0A6I8UH50_DROPS|nr:1-acylglycerol-3-phosphate O-acyltransferase Pnpla3 [Drosophila pseudoobscura]